MDKDKPQPGNPVVEGAKDFIRKQLKKEKMTTTKKITWLVVFVWMAALTFGAVAWLIKGVFPTELLNAVNMVAVPTILSYAVRAGVDFVTRLKTNGTFSAETK